MQREWIVEDQTGKVIRSVHLASDNLYVVRRGDNRRLELRSNLNLLNAKKIKYELLGAVRSDQNLPIELPRQYRLRPSPEKIDVSKDRKIDRENGRQFFILWLTMMVLAGFALNYLLNLPSPIDTAKSDLEQQLVKIVKLQEIKEKTQLNSQRDQEVKPTTPKPKALQRLGALAVLGSLKASQQRGGVNINSISSSAGIGLGGTQGSGGIQTSLYGKGLISAPLGAGGNIKGAGGYGTKGKGGGQAGYGELNLAGSAGTQVMPMSQESTVDGGLNRDMIAEVVRKNQGQIMFCYEQGLQMDPKIAGRVVVRWMIDASGTVKTANVQSTSLNAKAVEDCILLRLRSWKFPMPQGGVDVSVTYPFVLKRAGQG